MCNYNRDVIKYDMQNKEILFENLMNEYILGSITEDNQLILLSLVAESDQYKERYSEMTKLYALLHVPVFEARKEEQYRQLKQKLFFVSSPSSRHYWYKMFRHVAALLILIATVSTVSIYSYTRLDKSGDQMFNETTVPLGSQTKINLPDGSVAVLNSGSVLKYPLSYGKKERNVYLVGEGYFEVAKDKKKAFQVYVGDMKIKVTGTVFNVRSYPEDHSTEVSLINGGVDIFANNKYLRLKSDEKAVYDRNTGDLYSETTDSYKSSLWTTGRLSFVNTSFLDILKDIERKYNIKIHVNSNKVVDEYFSGSIDLNMSLQEVFNFIDVDKKYRFEQSGNVITLRDR